MTFSIITPSYGQLEWLRLCVASVADQVEGEVEDSEVRIQKSGGGIQVSHSSPLRVEHIIQDGGTQGIEEFARELGEELKSQYGGDFVQELQTFELLHFRTESGYSLRVFKEPDLGMYDAINRGIARSKGDLWAWLNCDEQYLPGTLAYVAEWFSRHPGIDILCGDALLTDEKGRAISYRRSVAPSWIHTRLVHLSSLSCASFYRRSIVDRWGVFDTTWRSIGDAEWMSRMLKGGVRVECCARLLSSFAFTGQNTSESPLAKEEALRWRTAQDAPPRWLSQAIIFHHRIRKFLAGSYAFRSVSYRLHNRTAEGRVLREADRVGWGWPFEKPQVEFTQPGEVSILGTPLLVSDYKGLGCRVLDPVINKEGAFAVDFANTHVVTMRRHHGEFARITDEIDITVPDGMPLVWAMNRQGARLKDRIYGPTFTRRFLHKCPKEFTHYLVGGSEECGSRFRERMLSLNPGLKFVGGYHGMCSEDGVLEDEERVIGEIQEKRPDFIWVGLGTPKQYEWIFRIKPQLEHGVLLAVGFALDVNAGMKPDAPAWMQRLGLTWVYRMVSEPRRLAGRYLKWNSLFLFYYWSEVLMIESHFKQWKLRIRNAALRIVDLFASEIRDCVSGKSLGRGLVIGWRGVPIVIGHPGLPPLIPRFLQQRRLTYWKQRIGFTTHPAPDFPRIDGVGTSAPVANHPRVMNLILAHEGGEVIERLRKWWGRICPEENLWIVFGGTREVFDQIDYPRKVFIDDSGLRKSDNQREKQSYAGIFRAMAPHVREEKPDYLYLCEYDQIPLVSDLNQRQVAAIKQENADVMGHWLYRVDGTGHYHALYHEADGKFLPFWEKLSRRDDPSVILSMFGSGSMWTRDAFLGVADQNKNIECYLELYLPSLAHHLGYRVRGWRYCDHLISNLPSHAISVEEAKKKNCWTVHPVKEISEKS